MGQHIVDNRRKYSRSREWPRDRVKNEPSPSGSNNEEMGERKRGK